MTGALGKVNGWIPAVIRKEISFAKEIQVRNIYFLYYPFEPYNNDMFLTFLLILYYKLEFAAFVTNDGMAFGTVAAAALALTTGATFATGGGTIGKKFIGTEFL